MKKTKKVYLPPWTRWFLTPLFLLIWGLITYLEFFSTEQGELGTVGYVVITLVLLGSGVMMWLMSTGKLPSYIIEEEE